MKNQQMLVVIASAPHDAKCVVDVSGTGKTFLPVVSVEVKNGQIVINCATATAAAVASTPPVANGEGEGGEGGGDDGGGDGGEGGDGTMDPPPEGGGEGGGEGGDGERSAGVTAPKITPPPAVPAGNATVLE